MTGFSVSAATLEYRADFSMMSDTDATALDICGFPQVFVMSADKPLAPTFINELFVSDFEIKNIQATEGSISGGAGYVGDYREKVYIVNHEAGGHYSPAVYYRVQITTYGSTAAPHGFVASSELLNHRDSAELAEGNFCGEVYYKLK